MFFVVILFRMLGASPIVSCGEGDSLSAWCPHIEDLPLIFHGSISLAGEFSGFPGSVARNLYARPACCWSIPSCSEPTAACSLVMVHSCVGVFFWSGFGVHTSLPANRFHFVAMSRLSKRKASWQIPIVSGEVHPQEQQEGLERALVPFVCTSFVVFSWEELVLALRRRDGIGRRNWLYLYCLVVVGALFFINMAVVYCTSPILIETAGPRHSTTKGVEAQREPDRVLCIIASFHCMSGRGIRRDSKKRKSILSHER